MVNEENAVVRLCQALERIAAHRWPREIIPSVRELFEGVGALTGTKFPADDLNPLLERLGAARKLIEGTLADVATPTMLEAGYKHNVVP